MASDLAPLATQPLSPKLLQPPPLAQPAALIFFPNPLACPAA